MERGNAETNRDELKQGEKMNMKRLYEKIILTAGNLIFLTQNAYAAEAGEIPQIGNLTGPATTTDVTKGLGIFSSLGQFIMDYSIHITIFMMVLALIVLSIRGSWARGNQKSEEASVCRYNMKGIIEDGIYVMAGLMFVFFILAPFVKTFIPQ